MTNENQSDAPAIEKGVPLPAKKGARAPDGISGIFRSLAAADIGDSVFFKVTHSRNTGVSLGSRAQRAAGNGWYTCRTVPGGYRFWKIAEPKAKA